MGKWKVPTGNGLVAEIRADIRGYDWSTTNGKRNHHYKGGIFSCFDMAGTLIKGTTSNLFYSKLLNVENKVIQLEND